MVLQSYLLVALSLTGYAFGHTIFQQVYVNGVSAGHRKGIRIPTSNSPIYDVTSNDIICNNPLVTPLDTTIIDIPAGATVTAEYRHGLSPTPVPSDGDDPIAASHKGPISVYLAKVSSALQTTVTGLQWFKIYEDGLHSDGSWAVDSLIANQGRVSFSLPTCVQSGEYLMRVELIALHGAGSSFGAQFYMGCAQIRVSGGGSLSPATVSLPGAYAQNHPGVLVNIYYPPLTSYSIPGPRPVTCGGANATTSLASTSSTRQASSTPMSSSSTRPVSSSTRTSSSVSGGAPLYGQCGGQGWTGPTVCAQGICTFSNQWYSQCLP